MSKFKDVVDKVKDGEFVYDTQGGGKFTTKMPLNKRSFKNQPKYSSGRSRVRFQDWLHIKSQKAKSSHDAHSIGKSEADGKWYGWSHRAVYGFGVGDKVEGDSAGKKVKYPKFTAADVKAAETAAAADGKAAVIPTAGQTDFDNGKYEPDFTIKTDAQAKQVALTFADSVS